MPDNEIIKAFNEYCKGVVENGKYTQHHRDKEADHPTEKGGAE